MRRTYSKIENLDKSGVYRGAIDRSVKDEEEDESNPNQKNSKRIKIVVNGCEFNATPSKSKLSKDGHGASPILVGSTVNLGITILVIGAVLLLSFLIKYM